MGIKHTILSEKRFKDLEDIIISKGRIVTSNDIYKVLGTRYSRFSLKKKIYELKKMGGLFH